jgi:hypothetical protein
MGSIPNGISLIPSGSNNIPCEIIVILYEMGAIPNEISMIPFGSKAIPFGI